MTDQNVQPEPAGRDSGDAFGLYQRAVAAPSEPSPWLDIADELERVAADCRDLVGEPAPRLFQLDIQPHNPDRIAPYTPKNRAEAVRAADAVAESLLGKKAETYRLGSGGGFHHGVRGERGPVTFSIYQAVADPDQVDPETELDRLRAEHASLAEENARLRAAAGLDHSRDDGPVDAHAGRVPPHLEDGRNPGEPADESCPCPTRPYVEGRGDPADTIVDHLPGCRAQEALA